MWIWVVNTNPNRLEFQFRNVNNLLNMSLALLLVAFVVNVTALKCTSRTTTGGSSLYLGLLSDTDCRIFSSWYSCYFSDSTGTTNDYAFCYVSVALYSKCTPGYARWTYNFDGPQPRPVVHPKARLAKNQSSIRKGDRITLDATLHLEYSSFEGLALPNEARLLVNGVFDTQYDSKGSCQTDIVTFPQPNCTRYIHSGVHSKSLSGLMDLQQTQVTFGSFDLPPLASGNYYESSGKSRYQACGNCPKNWIN